MSINISTPLKDKRILEEGLFPWSLHRDLLLSFNANSADIEDGELTLTQKQSDNEKIFKVKYLLAPSEALIVMMVY